MAQPSSQVYLITLGFLLELTCKVTMITTDMAYFNFTNLKVNLYPGFFNITWDCNITKAMEEYEYTCIVQTKQEIDLNISKCFFDYDITHERNIKIHEGLHIAIKVHNKKRTEVMKNEVMKVQEGKPNTSAKEFHCLIYNVDIMTCSWTAGKEAPNDTQYSLLFRYDAINDMCEDYRVDSFGRQIGCVLNSPKIPFYDDVYFQVVGSSNKASVQFLDGLFYPYDHVILDPPENITVEYSSKKLKVKWKHPKTRSTFSEPFFEYKIMINGEIKKDVLTITEFIIQDFNLDEKVNVSIRAQLNAHLKSELNNWGRWSDPIIAENPDLADKQENHYYPLIIGLVPAVLLIGLILLCYKLKIWKRLFPQVPQPSSKLFDPTEQKMLMEDGLSMSKCLSESQDNEECICLNITETTQIQ